MRQFVVVELMHGRYYDSEDVSEVRGPFATREEAQAFAAAQPKCNAVTRYYVAPVWAPGEQADHDAEPTAYEWAP